MREKRLDRKLKDFRQGSSGQAALEYVLVLIVSFLIGGGIFYKYNDAFNQFIGSYFGQYLTCLLESGELPALGFSGPSQATSCNDEYQPFSLANGRPKIISKELGAFAGIKPDSGGTKTPSNSTSKNSEANKAASGSKEQVGFGGASGGGRAESGGAIAGGVSPSMELGTFKDRSDGGRPKLVDAGGGEKGGEKGLLAGSGIFGNSKFDDKGRRIIPLSARDDVEDLGSDKKKDVPLSDSMVEKASPRRVPAESAKAPAVKTEEASLSFGDFMKYLLIAGIIIAMVVFFGGQVFQISKSKDK